MRLRIYDIILLTWQLGSAYSLQSPSDETWGPVRQQGYVSPEGCRGRTCKYIDSCGSAPLNKISSMVRSGGISERVINGLRQNYGEWPSFVKLRVHWSFGLSSTCGGTIITDEEILTAAHCLHHPLDGHTKARAKDIEVTLGEDTINSPDVHEKLMLVKSFCISKKFKERVELSKQQESMKENQDYESEDQNNLKTAYDFAVLKLRDKIEFNDYHQPSCLPRANFNMESMGTEDDPVCYLVGVGVVKTYKWGPPDAAEAVQKMPVVRASCEPYGFGESDESRECYTKKGSEGDSCVGDSGGPILCLDPENQRWTTVALVSYGTSNCDGEKPIGWVGVYTRVTNLLPMISDNCGI